jgi:HSP20 family protein
MSVYNKINRLFDEEFRTGEEKGEMGFTTWMPATDIYETKDDFTIKAEVPGLTKPDIKVELEGDTLCISGEKKKESEVKKENYHRIESYAGTFKRSFTLPRNVNPQKINAAMENGILVLRIPKIEEAKTKAIPITIK